MKVLTVLVAAAIAALIGYIASRWEPIDYPAWEYDESDFAGA